MNKDELIEIFEDTVSYTESKDFNSVTTKHDFSQIDLTVGTNECNIEVINSDTVSAGYEYSKLGKTCILNMASYKRAGGGVRKGARAQEECLFRCSNLFDTVSQDFYPLSEDEGLYTKDSVFFKNRYYNLMEEFTVDVVTVAAVNLNKNSYFDKSKNKWIEGIVEKEDDYQLVTESKIKLTLDLASKNECENIILGAWGCGVFKNDPSEMCDMFKNVLNEYSFNFKNVIFAVINDHNSVGDNYDVFNSKF
ncbi:MAG: gp114 [uncultured marine phage]|uniref:Gp114 n=1 Tax=uncultured marine phage TaxID=707152 RepID=A0A8D9C9L8_9VIRU|nr:MAG: gp114 [uncultured marine phage]